MDGYAGAQLQGARIKVIGVGGGGCNAINRMIEAGLGGVEFVAVNTDAQSLAQSAAPIRVRIGDKTTRGLGSGGDPVRGAKAAEESRDELRSVLEDADMIFLTAGMGGGTGTGASPIIGKIARDLDALTVGIVTKPFGFEGARRARVAEEGLQKLHENVDTLIAIQNDQLLRLVDRQAPLARAFLVADEILRQGIQGISEIINIPGMINVDFADVRSIMGEGGAALMCIGRASGDERALAAAQQAISSPLLDLKIHGAKGVLCNMRGGEDLTLHELGQAAELIRETAAPDGNIIWGAVVDDDYEGELQITVIATGFDLDESGSIRQPATAQRASGDSATPTTPQRQLDNSDLDIPAFLRRR
jgi:cell division protein FtsZ